MANTIKTRIQLRTDTLANWTEHDNSVKIYKGEAALALDNNKYIIKIGTSVEGSYWKDLAENITIPYNNLTSKPTLYNYQLIEVDGTPGTFKLQRRDITAANDAAWSDVSTIDLAFTGTYHKTNNKIALQDYVDNAVAGATTQYYEGIRQTKIHEGESVARPDTDQEVIDRVLDGETPKGGSTFVIKTLIEDADPSDANEYYEYIAFTYNTNSAFFPPGTPQGTAGVWMAMDGNYNADNVYFDQNFTLAGSYTQVGNIKLSDGTYNAKGKNLTTVLSDILDQTIQPTIGTAPSVSITLTSSGTKEVGTEFTPSYSITYNQGKYNQSWNNTTVNDGTEDTAWSVTDSNNETKTTKTGTFTKFTVTDSTNYKIPKTGVSVTYSDGEIAKDNKGNNSNPVVQRSGSTINPASDSGSVTGGRYTFYGTISTDNPTINSALIRGFTNKTFSNLSNQNLTIPQGTKYVIIAIPKSRCDKSVLAHIYDVNDSNSEINDAFVKQYVSVEGYDGYTAVDYSVYVLDRHGANGGAGLNADTYKITQ